MRRLLPLFALQAIVLLAAATVLLLGGAWPQILAAHLAFAVGLMPLIMAAMLHFIPVLTRTGSPPWPIAMLPVAAWFGGLLMLASFPPLALGFGALHGGAALGFWAGLLLLLFAMRRAIDCLGDPHPCVYWYQAALLCLCLALVTVFAMAASPQRYHELRLMHLHLNTLGFVGLTALGTLEVLVPTVLGRHDRLVSGRLRQGALPALLAVLLTAAGAAWAPWLADAGALLFLSLLGRSGLAWWRLGGRELLRRDSAAASLVLALIGLAGLIVIGSLHGHGVVDRFAAVPGFVGAFLLPLVTGAASHLLPAWWRPGVQGPWHADFRRHLGRLAMVRAFLLVVGGLTTATGASTGLWLVAAGLTLVVGVFGSGVAVALHAPVGREGASR